MCEKKDIISNQRPAFQCTHFVDHQGKNKHIKYIGKSLYDVSTCPFNPHLPLFNVIFFEKIMKTSKRNIPYPRHTSVSSSSVQAQVHGSDYSRKCSRATQEGSGLLNKGSHDWDELESWQMRNHNFPQSPISMQTRSVWRRNLCHAMRFWPVRIALVGRKPGVLLCMM